MTTNLSKRELLKKKRQEQKRRKTIRIILIAVGAILLIALAAFLPNLLIGRSEDAEGRGFTLGDPEAPVRVINFSNYACGHCETFSRTAEPEFIANYVETGDVYYRYVNVAYSTDENTQNAARASYCADDQNGFFEYKTFLYTVANEPNGFSTSNLIELAAFAGLDPALFEACLTGDAHTSAPREDLRFAQAVGVTGTPSFLVNDQLVFSNELIPLVDSLLNQQ
jgi:protein-disulfide isomerase